MIIVVVMLTFFISAISAARSQYSRTLKPPDDSEHDNEHNNEHDEESMSVMMNKEMNDRRYIGNSDHHRRLTVFLSREQHSFTRLTNGAQHSTDRFAEYIRDLCVDLQTLVRLVQLFSFQTSAHMSKLFVNRTD